MRKIIAYTLFLISIVVLPSKVYAQDSYKYFYGQGCSHCAKVDSFFQEYSVLDKVNIEKFEVYSNKLNAIKYNDLMDALDYPVSQRGVPAFVINDQQVIMGDEPIIDYIKSTHAEDLAKETPSNENVDDVAPVVPEKKKSDFTVFTVIAASIVDAVNPCAFAVLIILMSTVLVTGDSKRALRSGFAFATSIFISYLLMGLGLYRALSIGNLAHIFFSIIGWLAIIVGLLNLKDYFWYGKGFIMEVPLSWRPRMKQVISSVTSPIGAFGVGFIVSLFLLPCTSGPYIVILGMLAKRAQMVQAVAYLVLYNLIFVSPMFIITYAVYKGFDPKKAEAIRQKRLKTLHLVAGILMLGIGIAVLSGAL